MKTIIEIDIHIYKPVYSNGKVCLLIQYFPAYSGKKLNFALIYIYLLYQLYVLNDIWKNI